MAKLQEWLEEELRKLPESEVTSPSKIDKDHLVLTTLKDPYLQRLSTILALSEFELEDSRRRLGAEIDELRVSQSHKEDHDPLTCEGCTRHMILIRLQQKVNFVEGLLQSHLQAELSDEDLHKFLSVPHCQLAISSDWQVAIIRQPSPLMDMLTEGLTSFFGD